MFGDAFRNRTVWLSGHTGFKGAWLAEWLLHLGARVHGFALPPTEGPSLCEQLNLTRRVEHVVGDVRDREQVRAALVEAQPDFVFHLAAQPLVRRSYHEPVETYATNVMGTVHVMEALRHLEKPCAAVIVTTDKCYENREWIYGYREDDPLGGHDPYSSSKGMAELAISAYRRSFFGGNAVRLASARAGNVIGGGDWAEDRIVPDCVRALLGGRSIPVRNRAATRPWQHVLEPLSGYLWLAARLAAPEGAALAGAFNFGPGASSNRTVAELVQEVLVHWPGGWEDLTDPDAPHEAGLLQLSTDKARAALRWSPVWDFGVTMRHTIGWYRDARMYKHTDNFQRLTRQQINQYCESARTAGHAWTRD